MNSPRKKCLLMAWTGFVLSLVVAQHVDSQGLAAIHQVLTKSGKNGFSVIIKLRGKPAYKVIPIGKKEILIALKDTELSKQLCNKQITGTGLMQRIEMSKKPNNVSCLLVKLRKPYLEIDHRIEATKGRLHVHVTHPASAARKTRKPSKITLAPDDGSRPKSEIPARSAEGGSSPRPAPAPQCQAVAGALQGSDKEKGLQTTCPPLQPPVEHGDGRPREGEQAPKNGSDSPLLHAKSPARLPSSRLGGIDQLLIPDSRDTTAGKDLFLDAVERFHVGDLEQAIRILDEIIRSYPESPHLERAYFLLASSYHHKFKNNMSEHFVEVHRYYQDAISRFPNSVFVPDAMVSIGKCYAGAENYYEALAHYSLVCEHYEAYAAAPEALFERGKTLALIKKPQEAVDSFQQVEKLYPETPFASMARISRAKALFDMNNFESSLRVLDEIMTAEPNKIYENPEILFYTGYNYYELGRLEKARDVLCKVLNYCPDMESNHLILARIADSYREQGMESKALKLYNMVLRKYPDSEGSLISRLRLSADIRKVEEMLFSKGVIEEIASSSRPALETYKEIMKAHGENPLSQLAGLRRALQQQKNEDYEGSVNILEDILTKYPDTPLKEQLKSALNAPVEAIFEREQRAGNYEKIVAYYEEIKANLGVKETNLLLMLGDAYRRLHLYEHAISAFEEAGKAYIDQDQPASLLFGLGDCFHKVKRFEEARRALIAFIDRYPDDPQVCQAYFLIGDIMLRQREYEEAIAAFDLAMQKKPDEPSKMRILLAMGVAMNGHGDYDRASRLLTKAIGWMNHSKADLAPDAYEAYQELGESYLKLGDDEQAVSAFEKALEVSPKGRADHSLQFRRAECYQRLREKKKTKEILNQMIASTDPFWSKMAEAKINEIEIDMDFEDFRTSLKG